MAKFYLEDYISEQPDKKAEEKKLIRVESFDELCRRIDSNYEMNFYESNLTYKEMRQEKMLAFTGNSETVRSLKEETESRLDAYSVQGLDYPGYCESLKDAVFEYIWGLGELSRMFTDESAHVKTAVVIGRKLYFRERGRMILKNDSVRDATVERIMDMVLKTDSDNLKADKGKLVIKDGVTVYVEKGTYDDTDIIVFRRSAQEHASFEQMAGRRMIPAECIDIFRCMIKAGMNIIVTGPGKTGKTDFLAAWQSMENPELIGEILESAPDIFRKNYCSIMPVICRTVNTEADLSFWGVTENEAEYFLIDVNDTDLSDLIACRTAASGKRRTKLSYRCDSPFELLQRSWISAFSYVISFETVGNGRRKLTGLHEIVFDEKERCYKLDELCSYDRHTDLWNFSYGMSIRNEKLWRLSGDSNYNQFDSLLMRISEGEADY